MDETRRILREVADAIRARLQLAATPGQYVTLDRQWKSGDKIEIAMPLSFRKARPPRPSSATSMRSSPAPSIT